MQSCSRRFISDEFRFIQSMERGELCRDRCVCLLLAEPVQDTGAAKPNAGGDVQALDLSPGFGDLNE